MTAHVPLMKLKEYVNDDGETVLTGMFGLSTIVGRKVKDHTDGGGIWFFQLAEPDERARARKRFKDQRRRDRIRAEDASPADIGGMCG